MTRSLRSVILAAAGIVLLVTALAACGSVKAPQQAPAQSPSPSPAATTTSGFAGYMWTVVTIAHDGAVTQIPARSGVYLVFMLSGEYDNSLGNGASYRETTDGFKARSNGAVFEYGGHDAITLLAGHALESLYAYPADTAVTGDSLEITVNHGEWILTCQRDGEQPSAAPASETGFVGYKWTVTAMSDGGPAVAVPARDNTFLAFTRDGQFVANEPVNTHGGPYWVTPTGFTTGQVATTLVAGGARDPGGALAIQALDAFSGYDHPVTHAVVDITGDVMVVRESGYTFTCRRDGVFFLPPVQSSSPPPSG